MNKFLKGAVCAGLCCTMLTATAVAGCKNSGNETRVLKLATAALDGNFNPFFYTSLTDGNMVAMTQLSLMTNDYQGKLVCGDDWETVALANKKTMYDADGKESKDGSMDGTTVYEYVIKNGIKFSDGTDLTVKDVLFNMYVYLDPAYTGSITLYSTDIQGLNAYRMQDPLAQDGELSDVDESFRGDAQTRINNIIKWSQDPSKNSLTDAGRTDVETVKKLFKEEIESDWTAVESSWYESYKTSYRFKSAWEAYLFQEGIVSIQTKLNGEGAYVQIYEDTNGNGKKDDGELYFTTLDPDQMGSSDKPESQHIIDEVEEYVSSNIESYKSKNDCTDEVATLALQREICMDIVYRNYTSDSQIYKVLSYWATGNAAMEEFVGDARTAYYKKLKDENEDGLLVKSISGITTYKTSTFDGKNLGSEHDVLKVTINGVDPKAEYNFAFSVAPMNYYSGTYNGVNYVAEADGKTKFGVDMGNKNFYDTVVQAKAKNGLPVGAGAYKASTKNEGATLSGSTFYDGSIVYFERNDNFETVGSKIDNAKIKKVNYLVMRDDQIVSALKTGEIDYGEPNAKPDNQNEVNAEQNLSSITYRTGGYGYIGVNPKFVPEVNVRRAIMKAMNVNLIFKDYYGEKLATRIFRPMSDTSWAYPQGAAEYPSIAFASDDKEIIELVESAGYKIGDDGIYAKGGTKLEFTFTIAGDSSDHPALTVFTHARDRLNKLGFKIQVGNNIQALRLMNSGSLAVWAAAYTSASDPDLYQVYHKDSKATSVNSWNYSGILNDTQGIYSYELGIIETLSTKIEEARQSIKEEVRKPIYAECLDLIMDLAVQLPTYQRNDLCVYNKNVIDAKTLNTDNKTCIFIGPIAKIWEVDYV